MTDVNEVDSKALEAMAEGIAEANRRARGDYDGLLGQLPTDSSPLLRDIVTYLRDYLLDRLQSEEEARRLLDEYEPRDGGWNTTPVLPDIELALGLLISVRSAMRCDRERFTFLLLGEAGVRDRGSQQARISGGKSSGKKRKSESAIEHEKWVEQARRMIASGMDAREVSAAIARRVDRTPTAVRTALQKAGVVPRRNETKAS